MVQWLNLIAFGRALNSVEEAKDLATNMVLSGLIVVDDALVGGEDDETELSRGKDLVAELLEVLELQIESGRDHSALVESTVQVDNNLAISLVIDDLELADVAVLLHGSEELDEHLGDWSQHNLENGLVVVYSCESPHCFASCTDLTASLRELLG